MRLSPTARRMRYGHILGGDNPQQSNHMLHLYFFFRYIVEGQKHCVCVLHPDINSLRYISYLVGKVFGPNWSEFWIFMSCLYSIATPVSTSMITVDILVRYLCCVTGWVFLVTFSCRYFYIKCGLSFTWLLLFCSNFWCFVLYHCVSPCIGYYSAIDGV